ncbi:MFS transporter [Paenibacillus sp. D2_2]|uniref:MFS transporter n=1 Tax=Paenibacillus sp. D2_2 TaxID=3073092 RepID=UPI0028151EC2|nr:MFS transporter [Paenibacillus sp. D2_2]WMT42955.1 MFS transporter [Paenibacillus sp. D2_2]
MTITSNSSKFPIRLSPFFLLTMVIIISGLSQGLLLPVLAIFMEERGIPSSVNGMHAAALYVGSFAMTLVAERVLGRAGFKKLLIGGMVAVMIALPIFPLVSNLSIWFVLRLIVGIGDSAIHFTSQLWLLLLSPKERRGRNLSLYGMSYGLGFSFGPFGIRLLSYGQLLPFILLSILTAMGVLLVMVRMPNMYPEKVAGNARETRKYGRIYRLAWFALFTPLLYGYMESTMNSNFPIYGLRIGLSAEQIATLLPFFGIGGLILQLPLGMLSDRYNRKLVLMIARSRWWSAVPYRSTGRKSFLEPAAVVHGSGGLVGSFFSLGLAYTADILPAGLLPAANVIASFHFCIGSILGPNVGGAAMEFVGPGTLFVLLGSLYMIFTLAGFGFRKQSLEKNENMNRL